MTEVEVLSQLVDSMSDAVGKLEEARELNKLSEFSKLKGFILEIQKKINEEVKK